MGTLKEDIKIQTIWIIEAFKEDGLKLDYTIKSFVEIDKFFNQHTKNGKASTKGRLAVNLGPILFSIASYVGESLIRNVRGSVWVTDDIDPEGEINISVQFPDGMLVWPMQRVMKRFKNGEEDSIYVYGYQLTKEFINGDFDSTYWEINREKKKWWSFGK